MKNYKIFVINPGSTSTKIALFEGETCLFTKNVAHDAKELKKYNTINEQLPYRKEVILNLLKEHHIDLKDVDAFVGRGGSLYPMESGVYEVDDLVLEHIQVPVGLVKHPANLAVQLADELAKQVGAKCYFVNPPVVDEYCDVARVTGIKGVYRSSNLHALNLKETAIHHATLISKTYEDCNFVVCHIGGGISISAHRKGKMIDGNDIAGGEGPMAPTRSGSIAVADILRYAKEHGIDETMSLAIKTGGFVSHFATSNALEVVEMAKNGNKEAKRVWETMIYQICKYIGSMACSLEGKVDGILLSGGMVHNADLVQKIKDTCEWIAPVTAYPGEFEMEALANGALRVLKSEEQVKKYTGKPVWNGFDS